MRILITGIDGYVGWPLALRLSRRLPRAKIVGVDNLARRKWVRESNSTSAIPIQGIETRLKTARANGFERISFQKLDLTQLNAVHELVRRTKPDLILHLAAQPSAPYSESSPARAHFTQANNVLGTLNLLWSLRNMGLDRSCTFVETTTMGIYGAPEIPIPEGFLEVSRSGKQDRFPYPGLAGSWYHITKAHDFSNLYLAHRQWKLPAVDLRTAIVYGTGTEETNSHPHLATRFDFDYYFGIVINRFCAMAVVGHPMSIYGTGERGKPFIALEDCVESLVRIAEKRPESGFQVLNQLTEVVTITELAREVESAAHELGLKCEMKWIENPRSEKDTHKMEVESPAFQRLLGQPKVTVHAGIREILTRLLPVRPVIQKHRSAILPKK